MLKFAKKKIFFTSFVAIFLVLIYFFVLPEVINYLRWQKTKMEVRAATQAATAPWQDGGTITKYIPKCILDTPAPPATPVTCQMSCPLISPILKLACAGYSELGVVGQLGARFIAVPIGFIFSGGKTPTPGMSFIAAGASPTLPWVIGIPGSSSGTQAPSGIPSYSPTPSGPSGIPSP
jgi:hypothetical protein